MDGTGVMILDENPSTAVSGDLGVAGVNDEPGEFAQCAWGIVDNPGASGCTEVACGKTVWFDEVHLYPGEVWPTGCPDPVFDINGDGQVDAQDYQNAQDEDFVSCQTGPAAPTAVFEARPQWCQCLDVNLDASVDQTDFAGFQRCLGLTGSALTACDD
jgi:hypothetical protein